MMLIIQLFTLVVTALCLYFIYKKVAYAACGTALFFFMPYRLYVSFDLYNKHLALAYAFLPIIFLCVNKLIAKEEQDLKIEKNKKSIFKKIMFIVGFALSMLAVSYLSTPIFVFLTAALLLIAIISKKTELVLATIGTVLLSIPVSIAFWQFVFTGNQNNSACELQLIATKGYYPGQLFMSWTYQSDRPGLGFGLIISLVLIVYYLLTEKFDREKIKDYCLFVISVVFIALSMRTGFWDYACRISPIIHRFVSTMGAPSILMGLACSFLSVCAVKSQINLYEKRIKFVSIEIPAATVIFVIIAGVYMIVNLNC